MSKKIYLLIFLGFFLRLVLMPSTLHPDLWAISFGEHAFAYEGITNIYDYLANLPSNSLLAKNYGTNFFTYPPLAYFTLGIFGFVLKPFYNAEFFSHLAENLPMIFQDNRIFFHLFLTKFPYLFFDLGIIYLFSRFFTEPKKKALAIILWLFNPLSLYTSYMVGQFDVIPVFLTLLSLFLVKKKKNYWAALCLGLGGAFKMFPLFFLPFLALSEGKSWASKIKILLVGLLPYLLSIAPFVGSGVFRQTVLFSNQSQKMLFAKIMVSGAEYLSWFVVFYVFLLALSFKQKKDLWSWFLAVLLVFFSFTHYHPQWFLWITPFLVFFIVERPKYKILTLGLFFCWLTITLLFEPSLSLGLFSPISPSLIKAPDLSEALNHFYPVFEFKSLVRSIFAGLSAVIAFLILRRDETI